MSPMKCRLAMITAIGVAGFANPQSGAAAEEIRFSPAAIHAWEPHHFSGETRYELIDTAEGEAVEGICDDGTASGLFYRQSIDLTRTPVIEWRWRILDPISGGDPMTRAGDDYAARLYAVDEHSVLRWRTRALNYVSSTRVAVGEDWPNAYASQAHMLAVDNASGDEDANEAGWQVHRRNLREDFERFHDRSVDQIDAIALMTDCDDTNERAEVHYGEIRLLPESALNAQ